MLNSQNSETKQLDKNTKQQEELINKIKDLLEKTDLDIENINKIIVKEQNADGKNKKDNILSVLNIKADKKDDERENKKVDLVINIASETVDNKENKNFSNLNLNEIENIKIDKDNNISKTSNNELQTKESAEKLIKLLDKLSNIITKENKNEITKLAEKNVKGYRLNDQLSNKEKEVVKNIIDRLKNLSKEQFKQLKEELNQLKTSQFKNNTKNNTENYKQILNKIEIAEGNKAKEKIITKKIITEVNKLSKNELKNITETKRIVIPEIKEKVNTQNTKQINFNDSNSNNNTKQTLEQINKVNNKENNAKTEQNNKSRFDIKTNQKLNKTQSNKTIQIKDLKLEGENLKDTSEIKVDNKLKEKLSFNNLDIKLSKEDNNKYKKINNIKFLNDKAKQQSKDNILGFKESNINKTNNNQNKISQFKNMIKENDVLKQVKEKINVRKLNNKNQVEIKLKPESLGKLKIRLSVESNKLVGKILVENSQIQSFLENNLQNLKNNLVSKGLQVDQFSIESDNKNPGNQQGNQNSNNSFQQFKGRQDHRNSDGQNSGYEFFNQYNSTPEELEQITQSKWQSPELYRRGFEYFA